ncbi:MAG: hypothetical protein ABI557_03925 [Aureliella sp.]
MLANFRLNCQKNLIVATFALLALLSMGEVTLADETMISTENSWITIEFSAQSSQRAQIRYDSRRSYQLNRPTFVITHGMGGTETADRFHQLADAICKANAECNVLMIDWSKQSRSTGWFGILNPLAVAKNIDPVAREASKLLKTLPIDPIQTTFIGESFGNCVNARIAETLGGRGRILAFNPPNDAGGYKTPDLRACSDIAWSFQTYSMFDTQESIADIGIFLETSLPARDMDQHIAGVSWLAERVRSGDLAWLLATHNIPGHQSEYFDAIGTLSGELLHLSVPRQRPTPVQVYNRPPVPMLAAATPRRPQE